jgi:cobalt/nickel transport system permease protein
MIGTLERIDYQACSGTTAWHRASAASKLALGVLLVGLAVATRSVTLLAALYACAWLLVLGSRMPGRLVLAAASYPLLVSSLFLIGRWDGSWITPARLLLRPLAASLVAVWLVGTTPYPDLFAPVSRLLPRSVGDGLFLTYRALFDLGQRADRMWRSLRLRGGIHGSPAHRLNLAGEGLAALVLHGFERSQRQYATMLLRGHSGRICGCRHWAELSRDDLRVAAVAAFVAAAAALLWGAR